MLNNLIIGDTSQLSRFFPDSYERISARNINFDDYFDHFYDRVYILFAEQRTFDKSLIEEDFLKVNVELTSIFIEFFSKISNKVIVYGTAELWNKHDGEIDINTEINYKYSPYVKSKEVLYKTIIDNRNMNKWENVLIIHPFNFNSLNRKEGFLFYKIFNSLMNDVVVNVGILDINRDLIHPKYLVESSLISDYDCIIGSGKLTNVENFIKELFQSFGKNPDDYIIPDLTLASNHTGNEFWLKSDKKYDNLLKDTVDEINKKIKIENE